MTRSDEWAPTQERLNSNWAVRELVGPVMPITSVTFQDRYYQLGLVFRTKAAAEQALQRLQDNLSTET